MLLWIFQSKCGGLSAPGVAQDSCVLEVDSQRGSKASVDGHSRTLTGTAKMISCLKETVNPSGFESLEYQP